MTFRASYDEMYLEEAAGNLGDAFDWVTNTCGGNIQDFANRFAESEISELFAKGSPKYTVGMTGAELANAVLIDLKLPIFEQEPVFFMDKSPEYWTGYILAGFQWYTSRSFKEIVQAIPMKNIIGLYHLGHEQDELKIFNTLNEWMIQKS